MTTWWWIKILGTKNVPCLHCHVRIHSLVWAERLLMKGYYVLELCRIQEMFDNQHLKWVESGRLYRRLQWRGGLGMWPCSTAVSREEVFKGWSGSGLSWEETKVDWVFRSCDNERREQHWKLVWLLRSPVSRMPQQFQYGFRQDTLRNSFWWE